MGYTDMTRVREMTTAEQAAADEDRHRHVRDVVHLVHLVLSGPPSLDGTQEWCTARRARLQRLLLERHQAAGAADVLAALATIVDTTARSAAAMLAERAQTRQIRVGDSVEAGEPGTDDYDTGRVVSIDGDVATVAWALSHATTPQRVDTLRPYDPDHLTAHSRRPASGRLT